MLAQAASFSFQSIDIHAVLPEIILTAAILAVLSIDLFLPDRYKSANAVVSMLGIGGAAIALFTLIGTHTRTTFGGSAASGTRAMNGALT